MVMCLYVRQPVHRAPVGLWSSSFVVLVFACFTLAGVNLFGLLGIYFVLKVFVHET